MTKHIQKWHQHPKLAENEVIFDFLCKMTEKFENHLFIKSIRTIVLIKKACGWIFAHPLEISTRRPYELRK